MWPVMENLHSKNISLYCLDKVTGCAISMSISNNSWNGENLNTLRPRQNGQHFAEDIFKRIFFNENVWISIKISLKFVPKRPINKIPALFQMMAWRRPGDKPLSEAMVVSLLTHKCVTRPQWVKTRFTQALIHCGLVIPYGVREHGQHWFR